MELGIRICIMLTNQRTHRIQGWPEPIIYGVYTEFLAGSHQIYGHIQCIHVRLVPYYMYGWHPICTLLYAVLCTYGVNQKWHRK
jgi:hypothetical protein